MVDLSDKGSDCEDVMNSKDSLDRCGSLSSDGASCFINTCADCGTTKTPIWRGGPAGPKVLEPRARGAYLKDSEKAEMYRLHKENPEVYTVEKLAKDYRIMRQRVYGILWLKEDEEKMEKKHGYLLDDSVEQLLDNFPEIFEWHDREFHVMTLPYKPDLKVMQEGWDGTIKDPDEVPYICKPPSSDDCEEEGGLVVGRRRAGSLFFRETRSEGGFIVGYLEKTKIPSHGKHVG